MTWLLGILIAVIVVDAPGVNIDIVITTITTITLIIIDLNYTSTDRANQNVKPIEMVPVFCYWVRWWAATRAATIMPVSRSTCSGSLQNDMRD